MKGLNLTYKLIIIAIIFILMMVSANTVYAPKSYNSALVDSINGVENLIINGLMTKSSVVHANILDRDKNIIETTIPVCEVEITTYADYEELEEEIIEPTIYDLYSETEIYELAKIIMCEAEGESQQCKEYVGQVVMNRVESSKFPDNIHDVIFQRNQFTPTFDGRWEEVEPNQDCYDAAYTVLSSSEPLTEALYFEACKGSSWHSRNLIRIAEIDNTRFYIE